MSIEQARLMSEGEKTFEKGIYSFIGLSNFDEYFEDFYEKLSADIHC